MTDPARTAGLVLAAGTATRFGGVKVLAPLDGRPLLAHVLDAARATGLVEIVVVLGAAREAVSDDVDLTGVRVVVNPNPEAGLSSSLHLGLAVRVAPSIAPVILEAIGDIPDAGLQMVRGDAYRAVGRETDARRAYEAAMAASGSAVTIAPPAAPIAEPPTPQLDVPPDDPDDDSDPFAGEP